jgi:hypothetical protein
VRPPPATGILICRRSARERTRGRRVNAAATAEVEAVEDAIAPWAAQHTYLNFSKTSRPRGTLWTEHAYRRLRQIKASVDPHNVIRSNHPVPPAR